MKFLVEWLDDGKNAAAEERATLCDLKIVVGDDNACLFFDDALKESFDSLTLPAVHLAEGLARDWWRIFGGRRDCKLSLLPYRTGFALPDLRFGCEGSTFEVECHQLHLPNPGLRFWQVPSSYCTLLLQAESFVGTRSPAICWFSCCFRAAGQPHFQ